MSLKEKIGNAAAGTAQVFLGAFLFVLNQLALWGGIILHLLTAWMILGHDGLLMAVLSLVFPVAAEIYMFILCWTESGFLNLYSLMFLAVPSLYLLAFLAPFAIGPIIGLFDRKPNEKEKSMIDNIPELSEEDGYDEQIANAVNGLHAIAKRHELALTELLKAEPKKSRSSAFLRDNQIVIAAAVLFLAVLVYCLFNRYDTFRYSTDYSYVIDHLTGDCYTIGGKFLTRR